MGYRRGPGAGFVPYRRLSLPVLCLVKCAKDQPTTFLSLLGKTIETEGVVRETVRVVNLTGLDLFDPKIRKRLGPCILGEFAEEGDEGA